MTINIPKCKQNFKTDVMTFDENNKFYANYDKVKADNIYKFLSYFDFKSVTSIYIQNPKNSFEEEYKYFNEIFNHKTDVCFKTEILHSHYADSTILKFLIRLAKEKDPTALVFFGSWYELWRLDKIAHENNVEMHVEHFWLLTGALQVSQSFYGGVVNVDRLYSLRGKEIELGYTRGLPDNNKLREDMKQPSYLANTFVSMIHHYIAIGGAVLEFSKLAKDLYFEMSDTSLEYEKGYDTANMYTEYLYWQNKKIQCTYTKQCLPGWEQRFVNFTTVETKWLKSRGFACRKCDKGFYKQTHGNLKCLKCEAPFVTNVERTECYDPYFDTYFSLTSKSGQVSFSIAMAINIMTLTTTIVFFVKRNTPLILACDAFLTLTDLVCSSSILTLTTLLFFGKPTRGTCILRPIVIVLYSFDVSIILLKSQKIVSAFSAKRRLSRSSVKTTKAAQIFLISLFTMVPVFVLSYLYLIELPNVLITKNVRTFERYVSCTNLHHVNLLIPFVIGLQLSCLIQAFRTRNIPNTFYNAMSIVYAALAGTLCLSVMFPIYYFLGDPIGKLTVQFVAMMINKFIFILKLYGGVLWKIVFRSKLNSKSYVRTELLKMNVQKANTRISTNGPTTK